MGKEQQNFLIGSELALKELFTQLSLEASLEKNLKLIFLLEYIA